MKLALLSVALLVIAANGQSLTEEEQYYESQRHFGGFGRHHPSLGHRSYELSDFATASDPSYGDMYSGSDEPVSSPPTATKRIRDIFSRRAKTHGNCNCSVKRRRVCCTKGRSIKIAHNSCYWTCSRGRFGRRPPCQRPTRPEPRPLPPRPLPPRQLPPQSLPPEPTMPIGSGSPGYSSHESSPDFDTPGYTGFRPSNSFPSVRADAIGSDGFGSPASFYSRSSGFDGASSYESSDFGTTSDASYGDMCSSSDELLSPPTAMERTLDLYSRRAKLLRNCNCGRKRRRVCSTNFA